MNKKVLVFKTGYTEFLDGNQNSRIVSMGDVLRTTCLLPKFKENQYHLTWVTSEEAKPLLAKNPLIDRLLPFDLMTTLQLESEEFDKIVNLEKIPGICALSDKVRARKSRHGFTFNSQTGEAEALDNASEVFTISNNPHDKKNNKRTFQSLLYELLGEEFNGEEYVLGYKPKTTECYDLGLNTNVGSKWPSKAWPIENWGKLEEILGNSVSISRQDKQCNKVLHDLHSYIDWINSCKTLISNDSLGLHVALALKKNVIGLFGPTSANEIYFYNRGNAVLPQNILPCIPCFNYKCDLDKSCMEDINPKQVAEACKDYLGQ